MKCEACEAFYFFFCNEVNKCNNTNWSRMLDSTYHMTLGLLLNHISAVKTS